MPLKIETVNITPITSPDYVGDRTGKLSKDHIKFTQWLIELIVLIVRDGTPVEDIALTNSEMFQCYEANYTPEYVYEELWEKDAGHYYKINF